MSINTVVLTGRLCADPEGRHSTNGTPIANFRLAVSRGNGKDETDFFACVAFQKTAEFVTQYLDKGALVGIEGRLQSRTWETDSGDKRSAVEVIANRVQALETRAEAEERRGVPQKPEPQGPAPAIMDDPFAQ